MGFDPEEVLFSPTARCNLACPHCTSAKTGPNLSVGTAERFLAGCGKIGIKYVGFTGGEPFLAPDFLCSLTRKAVSEGMLFDRIMTNGVWYKSGSHLDGALARLRKAGYDGSICVSVDAFHKQDLKKAARFIETAVSIWQRPDIVSIARTTGARDKATDRMLRILARLLGAGYARAGRGSHCIRNDSVFVRVSNIELSPVGKAGRLKDPWGGRWFKEDYCKGPGNAFFVMPDGKVKPCCGYAADSEILTIGNIKRDSAADILRRAGSNRFVAAVFDSGLTEIRKKLERLGVKFPGKTTNHCYLCYYILNNIPGEILRRCLK
ncbi:MAG: radical SAM protein [Candidatus Omnitrophota bacterium]|nr:radical SAM protein [Candidatus Omnitrophota bacterium]